MTRIPKVVESVYKIRSGAKLVLRGASKNDIWFLKEGIGAFNITRAVAWAAEHAELVEVKTDFANCAWLLRQIDLNRTHLMALKTRYLCGEKSIIQNPLLHVAWNDDSHVLIDGHHRLALICELRISSFLTRVIPYEEHQQFLVYAFVREQGQPEQEIAPGELLKQIWGKYG